MRNTNFVNKYGDFGTLYIFGTIKLETSYLAHIQHNMSRQRTTNCPLKWAWSGSRDLNLKFETPP